MHLTTFVAPIVVATLAFAGCEQTQTESVLDTATPSTSVPDSFCEGELLDGRCYTPEEVEQLAAFYAAVQLNAFLSVVAEQIAPGEQTWLAIGRCEQPGDGYGGVRWDVRGPIHMGGLGFAASTWRQFKLPGMPDNAGDASPYDQMRVASVLWRKYGMEPWGCRTVL